MPAGASPPSDPFLSVRTAVVMVIAMLTGIVAGVLGFFGYGTIAVAVLIGGGAAGGAMMMFHALLGR